MKWEQFCLRLVLATLAGQVIEWNDTDLCTKNALRNNNFEIRKHLFACVQYFWRKFRKLLLLLSEKSQRRRYQMPICIKICCSIARPKKYEENPKSLWPGKLWQNFSSFNCHPDTFWSPPSNFNGHNLLLKAYLKVTEILGFKPRLPRSRPNGRPSFLK